MKRFEEHIKTRVSSFQMSPEEGTFDKVMEALKKKKRRRFLFLWWLIPGILLAGSSLFCYDYLIPGEQASITTTTDINTQPQTSQVSSTIGENKEIPQTTNTRVDVKAANTENKTQAINHTSKTENTVSLQKKDAPINLTDQRFNHQVNQGNANLTVVKNNSTVQDSTDNSRKPEDNTNHQLSANNTRMQEDLFLIHPGSFEKIPLFLGKRSLVKNDAAFKKINFNLDHEFSKWSIGATASFGAVQNFFGPMQTDTSNTAPPDVAPYLEARKQSTHLMFGYSVAITGRFSPIQSLAIETGIGFSHYEANQILVPDSGFATPTTTNNDPNYASTYGEMFPGTIDHTNVYDYLTIPINIYYQKKWNHFGIEAGAGINIDIPVNTNHYIQQKDSSSWYYSLSVLSKDVKASQLVVGVQGNVNFHFLFHAKKWSFFAGPCFRIRMNTMYERGYIIEQRNYFIGAETGVRYHF